MKFQLDYGQGIFVIRGYQPGAILVNEEHLRTSFVITPDALLRDWPPRHASEISKAHIDALAELDLEILIIGTGARLRFPAAEVTAGLLAQNIGVEVMDTAAACRTYTALMAEGRRVAAALLMIEA